MGFSCGRAIKGGEILHYITAFIIAGLSLEDWASVIAILGGVGGVIILIIRFTTIMNNLQSAIQELNSTLSDLVSDNRNLQKRVGRIEDRFEKHIGEAKVRNNRIENLEIELRKRED